MIDYIEGVLNIDKFMKELKQALLAEDYGKAREICLKINVESRLLHQQIKVQASE